MDTDQRRAFSEVADEFRHLAGLDHNTARDVNVSTAVDADVDQQQPVPDPLGSRRGASRRVPDLDNCQPVLGQRDCVVRAEQIHAADGFAPHRTLDNRSLLASRDDTNCEARVNDGWRPFAQRVNDQHY